jgi:hypothetical protein
MICICESQHLIVQDTKCSVQYKLGTVWSMRYSQQSKETVIFFDDNRIHKRLEYMF